MKLKHLKNKATPVMIAILLWSLLWVITQGLFMGVLPGTVFGTSTKLFSIATAWLLIVMPIATVAWKRLINDWSFLKNIKKYQILGLLLPLSLILIALSKQSIFGVNSWLYVAAIVISVVWQDLLTFGFFQTYLESKVSRLAALLIVAACFYLGHILFQIGALNLQVMAIYAIGLSVLPLLRYFTKNIYLTSIVHLSFLLFFIK